MDLFGIIGTIWRYKVATIPVILITLIGVFYVLEVKPPTYQSTGEVLLANPPNPPTAAQIAADPALGKINANNPFLGYGNLVLVADVVIARVNSPSTQQALANEGANPKYTVALAPLLDNPPIIQVTETAGTASEAIKSAQLVDQAVAQDLYQMQAAQHVNPRYMIASTEVVKPMAASASSSSKLRTLIGFLALGLILLFIAVSIAQSLENRRRDRAARPRTFGPVRHDDFTVPTETREQRPQRPEPDQMPNVPPRDAMTGNSSWYRQ